MPNGGKAFISGSITNNIYQTEFDTPWTKLLPISSTQYAITASGDITVGSN